MDRAATHFRSPKSEGPQGPARVVAVRLEDASGREGPGAAELVKVKPRMTHVGRYVLKAPIGEGGWGCVFEAWDPLLSRVVAVKTLQFGLKMSSRLVLDRLLLNEARSAASLNHRHIVTVYDAGLSAHGVYLAMECLRGRDLRRALDDGWRPDLAEALRLARRIADALAYAHSRGVIHCDIKPGNIFLTRSGRPKVLDFGIARVINAKAVPELEGLVMGSPYYLSPEQLSGGAGDARADIYSLGVILYELLAGQKAFTGDSLDALREAVLHGRCTPLAELRPDLPKTLLGLVTLAMAVDAGQRPASAQALAAALRRAADGDSDGSGPHGKPGDDKPPTPAPRRRWGWNWRWALSGGTAGLLMLGMFTGVQSSTRPSTEYVTDIEMLSPPAVRPPTDRKLHARGLPPVSAPLRA